MKKIVLFVKILDLFRILKQLVDDLLRLGKVFGGGVYYPWPADDGDEITHQIVRENETVWDLGVDRSGKVVSQSLVNSYGSNGSEIADRAMNRRK